MMATPPHVRTVTPLAAPAEQLLAPQTVPAIICLISAGQVRWTLLAASDVEEQTGQHLLALVEPHLQAVRAAVAAAARADGRGGDGGHTTRPQ